VILAAVFIAVLFLARGLGALTWVLAAAASVLYFCYDVRHNPRVPCRVCRGSGRQGSRLGGGRVFRRPYRMCRCCGGRKGHPRLAARIIDPASWHRIRDEVAKARSER